VKNEDDFIRIRNYFRMHLPDFEFENMGFKEKLYLHQSQLWYSFIIQDFVAGYRHGQKWIDLFKAHPKLAAAHPVFYLKGFHYLLESLYYLRYNSKMKKVLDELQRIQNDPAIICNENMEMLSFICGSYGKLNYLFLNGAFKEGLKTIPQIEKELHAYRHKIDPHHVMVFYYKFACMHFGADNWERAVAYLDKITENKELGMRQDLLCYSRILKLICFYELGWDHHVDAAVVSTYKFLLKMNDLHAVQTEIFKFLRGLKDIYPSELKKAFENLYRNLKRLEDHPYEKRSFLYLDILSWLESKIEMNPISYVIEKKARVLK
jgi:hypothetical protein